MPEKRTLIDVCNLVLELPLDESRVRAKFDCTGVRDFQIHKEQTNIHLYILDRFLTLENKICFVQQQNYNTAITSVHWYINREERSSG